MKYNIALFSILISAAIIPTHVHSMEPEVRQLPASQLSDDKNVNDENSIAPFIFELKPISFFGLCDEDAARKGYGLIWEKPEAESDVDSDIEELLTDQMIGDFLESKYKKITKEKFMKEQRSHETLVSDWERRCITMQPTNTIPLTLTTNINNDIATVLLVQYNNNEQYAGMTHYSSLSKLKHFAEVERLCTEIYSTHSENKQITSINFFVTMPTATLIDKQGHLHYSALQNLVSEKLEKISPIKTHLIPYAYATTALFTPGKKRDLEVILHPDKATVISRNGNKRVELPLIK